MATGAINVPLVLVTAALYAVVFLLSNAPSPSAGRDTPARRGAVVSGDKGHGPSPPSTTAAPSSGPKHYRSASDIPRVTPDAAAAAIELNAVRREFVRGMTRHAWRGYMHYAAGADELKPVSNTKRSNWGSSRPTPFDAIDTLILMDMHDEADEAIDLALEVVFGPWNRKGSKDKGEGGGAAVEPSFGISVFETTIRHLGAMLSTYGLTNDEKFLQRAEEIAKYLLPAFETPTGIALHQVSYSPAGKPSVTNEGWCNRKSILAEAGTLQLEFRLLSMELKNDLYAKKANAFTDSLLEALHDGWPTNHALYEKNAPLMPHRGLWPTFVDPGTKLRSGAASMASLSDSFYEYQLKQWIIAGKHTKDPMLDMYEDTVDAILQHLLHYTPTTHWAYVGHIGIGFEPTLDHLTCFVPGMLTLGLLHGAHEQREGRHRKYKWGEKTVATAAVDLAATCYRMYLESPTGIGPEVVNFQSDGGYKVTNPKYILRPETIESFFYLYRYTHDERYRDWGWHIVEAINRNCRTDSGFSALKSVLQSPPDKTDSMESFFFAETLKYAFLLFSDDSTLPMEEYVLNTEGHPLHIPNFEDAGAPEEGDETEPPEEDPEVAKAIAKARREEKKAGIERLKDLHD